MRIGEIMDRTFQLLPQLIKPLLGISLAIAVLATLSTYLNFELQQGSNIIHTLLLFLPTSILQWILTYYFMLLATFLSDSLWISGSADSANCRAKVTFGKMITAFLLQAAIILAGMAWMLLFIIPGLIYFVNRIPAINIYLLENLSFRESLRKSKMLMTHCPGIPWYSFRTPMMRISAILLVSMVLNLMPAMISGSNVFFNTLQGKLTTFNTLDYVINFVASFLTMVFSTFGYLAGVGFYYDIRTRAQGIDLKHEIASLNS